MRKRWAALRLRYPDAVSSFTLLAVLGVITPIVGHYVYWRFVAVFYIGAMVGIGEIVARYRDAPESALWRVSALLYIAINAAAAVAALFIVQTFHLIEAADPLQTRIRQGFLGGFGAMAFFRSSVFTVRVGDTDVSIGPVAFLQVVLRATDRAVDRIRARARAEIVTKCVNGVSFERAYSSLPAFCLQLMQNVSSDEQNDVGSAAKVLKGSLELDNDTKMKNLALILLNVVGENVLATAIEKIGQQLQKTVSIAINSPQGAPPSTMTNGDWNELAANCVDGNGKSVPYRQPLWSADDPHVATIAATGHLAAVGVGKTMIRAKSDDAEAAFLLTVTP